MQADGQCRDSGAGHWPGIVGTARGLLMHEVVLENDRIADYRITNRMEFSSSGGAAGLARPEIPFRMMTSCAACRARRGSPLDPCVRWELIMA
ncbi:MAG: hypothetical protein IPP84_15230 [Propionivibrio sp.]|uniref:hypothetical protein n=1 Tax=Propionivibrio sp. TaxID=2212460 RepID=UPI0025D2C6CE|nr:hypothetical protein [Propionivibrio sp.]MBL0209232.1 hypothetical protein [Propionivibrio sp.]